MIQWGPMGFLFSDRFRWIKAGLAAAAFTALCLHADAEIARREPPLEEVPGRFDDLRGRVVHGSSLRVSAADPEGLEFATPRGPVRVIGQTSPAARAGDTVTFIGEVSGPGEIRASRLRLNAGHAWKRPLNYAVSGATLLAWAAFALWSARRRA